MRLFGLLLFAFAGIAQGQAVHPLQACIDAIVGAPENVERVEPLMLSEHCPALARDRAQLDALPLQDPLGEGLTIAQMLDLRAALASAAEPPGAARLADPAALGPILESMDTGESSPDLWDRFRAWLLEHLRTDEEPPGWLVDWLDSVEFDPDTAAFIFKALLVVVVLLALWVVLNELMKADLRLGGRNARREKSSARQTASGGGKAIESISATDQPAALLRRVLDALDRAGIIAVQRAWTNREYASAVRRRLPGAAQAFAALATAAELSVYAGRNPDEQERGQLFRQAEQIRDVLERGA